MTTPLKTTDCPQCDGPCRDFFCWQCLDTGCEECVVLPGLTATQAAEQLDLEGDQ